MMDRTPEPEVMDIPERALAYAEADFEEVNAAFVDRLLALVGDTPGARALDVGTGPGEMPLWVAREELSWRVTGLDASHPMLRLAAGRGAEDSGVERVDFILADAKRTPFRDGSFDVVFSNSILHHVEDAAALWREVGRVAKPGALVFLRDLLRPESPEAARTIVDALAADEHPFLQEDFYNSLLASYTVPEVEAQLREAGVKNLTVVQSTDRHLDVLGRLL